MRDESARPCRTAQKPAREIESDDDHGDILSPESILDPSEIRCLLDAANAGLDRTFFLTAFVTRARQGERLALGLADLELPTTAPGRVYIRRSLQWAHLKREVIRPRVNLATG
jgi:hypothetical protein